jgi:hypothetical protein
MRDLHLNLEQASALLDQPADAVLAKVRVGALPATSQNAPSLQISLTELARYVGTSADPVAVCGIRRALRSPSAWHTVFGHGLGEITPGGSTGKWIRRSLERAVAISEVRSA